MARYLEGLTRVTLDMRIRCLCERILPTRPSLALQQLAASSPRGERLYTLQCACGRIEWVHAGDVQNATEIVDARRLTA